MALRDIQVRKMKIIVESLNVQVKMMIPVIRSTGIIIMMIHDIMLCSNNENGI